jgi:N-acetylglucosamine malate deacetylase 1
MIKKFKNVLTFFAHPDDETLAAGATINKFSQAGANIHVAIPNTGVNARKNVESDKIRKDKFLNLQNDCLKALSKIGIKKENIFFGEFFDNESDKHSLLELIHWFEEILKKVKPDVIFTHHRYCTNIDHRYCHEAAVVATRPDVNLHIPVICGEVPSSTGYLKPVNWEPNFFVEVSKNDIDKKIEAMQTYKDEARPDPHPRSPEVLKALAKVRGSESGYLYAEAFMIQKTFY